MGGGIEKEKRKLSFSSLPSLANTSPVNSEDDTTRRKESSLHGGYDVARYHVIGSATHDQNASKARSFLKEFRTTSTVEQGSEFITRHISMDVEETLKDRG